MYTSNDPIVLALRAAEQRRVLEHLRTFTPEHVAKMKTSALVRCLAALHVEGERVLARLHDVGAVRAAFDRVSGVIEVELDRRVPVPVQDPFTHEFDCRVCGTPVKLTTSKETLTEAEQVCSEHGLG